MAEAEQSLPMTRVRALIQWIEHHRKGGYRHDPAREAGGREGNAKR